MPIDPVTAAIAIKTLTITAFQIRDIFRNETLTPEEADAKFAEILLTLNTNLGRNYEDYDPNLDEDIVKAGGLLEIPKK